MSEIIIPTLNISKFTDGADAGSQAIAERVNQACEEIGFLIIEGHGVPDSVIGNLENCSRKFFDLPVETKQSYFVSDDTYFGYKGMKHATLAYSLDDEEAKPDLREQFGSGRPDYPELSDDYYRTGMGLKFKSEIRWPQEVIGFQAAWATYYNEMARLSEKIMRVFAVALELPIDYFDSMLDKHVSSLGIYNYPEQKEAPEEGQLRGGAHTDFGSLTIVQADWSAPGGLQVFTKDEEWMDVPARPGSFAINIGDMMERWTNDRWVSTLHRVANPPGDIAGSSRRQSVIFFNIPNYDALVECIPTCTDSNKPAKYPPITVAEHHLMKMGKMFDVDDEV